MSELDCWMLISAKSQFLMLALVFQKDLHARCHFPRSDHPLWQVCLHVFSEAANEKRLGGTWRFERFMGIFLLTCSIRSRGHAVSTVWVWTASALSQAGGCLCVWPQRTERVIESQKRQEDDVLLVFHCLCLVSSSVPVVFVQTSKCECEGWPQMKCPLYTTMQLNHSSFWPHTHTPCLLFQ